MADNLAAMKRRTSGGGMPQELDKIAHLKVSESADEPKSYGYHSEEPAYLPDEIILEILDYVRRADGAQQSLAACCRLSHQWFNAAVPLLYARPFLYGKNFDLFVRAICPSINLHVRKSPLSELVRSLNMANLVHQGSKSMTARLLGRTKTNLEEFVAPQASFAINCYPALSKCSKLKLLDLSLVSESASLQTLFNTVRHLQNLSVLRLPRSSGFGPKVDPDSIFWPPSLESLFLSGGIDDHFCYGVVRLPVTLRELTIEHCPQAKGHAVRRLLETIATEQTPLRYLRIAYMPRLGTNSLDNVLALFPSIEHLSLSVDYVTPALFDLSWHHPSSLTDTELRVLELTNSGNPGVEDKLSPLDIMIAIDEGSLQKLRQVRVAKSLHWHHSSTAEELDTLSDLLMEAQKKDWEERKGVFERMSEREWRMADWKKGAGVWTLEG